METSTSIAGPSRRPISRRSSSSQPLGKSTAIFVLTLCVPYVAAAFNTEVELFNEITYTPGHASTSRHSSDFSKVFHSAASALGKVASKYLITGRGPDGKPPIFTFAASTTAAVDELPDDFVLLVQLYNPGFIVLSYLIAFVGSLCTLELLIRRTSNKGFSNQLLLTVAGCCFGAVSTFAMHFVGNNSLSLHHPMEAEFGYQTLYLSYGAGFTILSLIATCLAMTLAFFVMGTELRDWSSCLPGRRRRRRRRKSVKGKSDDYKSWKAGSKKNIKTNVATNAFWSSLSIVSQWSMLDGLTNEQSRWRSNLANKAGKGDTWDQVDERPYVDEEDVIIRRDKELNEMDFRRGRAAVREEIERRQGASSHLDSVDARSLRHMDSNASLIATQSPYKSHHPRSSSISSLPPPESTVFTEGFKFPPRINTDLSASVVPYLPAEPHSAPGMISSPTPWNMDTIEPVTPAYHPQSRRSSLPLTPLSPPSRTEMTIFKTATLSRIQSLPEPDPLEGDSRSLDGVIDDIETGRSTSSRKQSDSIHQVDSREDKADVEREGYRSKLLSGKHASALEKFLGFDVVTRGDIIKIVITGFTAGLGVAAMHYIGQLSIVGLPYIAYKPAYVVGSVIIACGAVIVALYIMFIMLRPKLKHDWYLKILVAVILAAAVCAMHYTGMRGTIYAWPNGTPPNDANLASGTKIAILALVASLAFVACLGVVGFVYLHSRKVREERNRRRRVVVAHVAIDPHGRILVNSSDGMLPMCDITSLTAEKGRVRNRTLESTSGSTILGLDLTTHHDAFVSALKMSWSWKNPLWSPNNIYAGMDVSSTMNGTISGGSFTNTQSISHQSTSISDARRGSALTGGSSSVTGTRPVPLSIAKFLEKFAGSSVQLAVRLTGQQDGVSRLGVLYDQILTTGWVQLSNSTDTVSKGQLIFLVRRVTSHEEQSDLLARHFIFADPSAVATSLHKTLSVPLEHTIPLLEDIRQFCDSTAKVSLKSGTLYTGVAVVQATPFDGLRILCEPENRSQLPLRELCTFGSGLGKDIDELSGTVEEIGEAVTWLDGMTLLSIITRNMSADGDSLGGRRVNNLLKALEKAIVPMLDEILSPEDMAHVLPRLTLHPVLVPLTPGGSIQPSSLRKPSPLSGHGGVNNLASPPYLVVFYANYDAAVNTFTDKWLPFSLFRAQNACVMSTKIQAASRAEHQSMVVGSANSDRETAFATDNVGYNYSRRLSKVQFEVPPSDPDYHDSTQPPLPQAAAAFNFPVNPTSTFGTFSFPSKPVPNETSAPSPASASATKFPFLKPKSEPRRSSLRSTPFSPEGEVGYDLSEGLGVVGNGLGVIGGVTAFGGAKDIYAEPTRSAGVAYWNPEWLLHLLKNKLKADA